MPHKGWRRVTARLVKMDGREMLERGRQEFSKRADTVLAGFGFDFARGAVADGTSKSADFFFRSDAIGSILETLHAKLPHQVDHIQQQAEKICSRRFDLLGYENLEYSTLNWHLDAAHGKTAPRMPFYKIRFLDFDEVGDSKITWELNRHNHLVTLAKAYRLTGDERYADEVHSQWDHWHAENPYPMGINWASSLEVAFRSLSWMWMFHLLEGSSALSGDFRKKWLRAQVLNGRHIEHYLSTYFSPNTHLLGEGVALFFLGVLCPELSAAKRWKSMGLDIVMRESVRQISSDGFHFEGSTYYHVYAVDFFLHTLLLARANQIAIPPEFEKTVERMLHALWLLGRAGEPPRFGDDDGGRLFDARRNRSEHLNDPLATGAVLFHRSDFKAAVDGLREETVWLLGSAGVEEFDRLASPEPTVSDRSQGGRWESTGLPQAGIYVAAAERRAQLVIYTGRQGEHSAGHMHADALSLCLQSGGETLLMDPGTLHYVGEDTERDNFRSTRMHNSLRVEDASQSEPAGPFSWRRRAQVKVDRWIQGESVTLFCGSLDGYTQHSPAVVHRRWVVALKSGLFLVRDVAEGEGETTLNISWHLGPGMSAEPNSLFRRKGSSQGLAILGAENSGWKEERLEDRWSPAYGVDTPATTVNFTARTKLPAELETLLLPVDAASTAPGRLTRVTEDAAKIHAYRYEVQDEEYLFFFSQSRPWHCLSVESDAAFVFWKRKEGVEEIVALCDGSYVDINQQRVLSARRIVSRCELVVRSGGREVFCSEPSALEDLRSRVSDETAPGDDAQVVQGDRGA